MGIHIYEPRPTDVLWTKNLLDTLTINGVWALPMTGQLFKKTGPYELTLLAEDKNIPLHERRAMLLMIACNLDEIGGRLVTQVEEEGGDAGAV